MQNLNQRKRIPHWTKIHRIKRDFPEGTLEKIKITSYFVIIFRNGRGYTFTIEQIKTQIDNVSLLGNLITFSSLDSIIIPFQKLLKRIVHLSKTKRTKHGVENNLNGI